MGSLPNFLSMGLKSSQTLNPKFVSGATSVKRRVLDFTFGVSGS